MATTEIYTPISDRIRTQRIQVRKLLAAFIASHLLPDEQVLEGNLHRQYETMVDRAIESGTFGEFADDLDQLLAAERAMAKLDLLREIQSEVGAQVERGIRLDWPEDSLDLTP